MSSINLKSSVKYSAVNSVGTPVPKIDIHKQLSRMTLASMLFEDQFYMNGKSHYEALKDLASKCDQSWVVKLALAARTKFKLRHVPLALMREVARNKALKAADLAAVIQRPDELGEFVSLYWKDGKQPLSAQVKKGLAAGLKKFNEFQLAKWDKNSAAVRIRDVLFLTHAKPDNQAQAALFKKLADDELQTPDTWETQLSAGADKKETFIRLMDERKLGALAFLRNLRNMLGAGVSESKIRSYSKTLDVERVLPFSFITAARYAPALQDMLETMMLSSLASHDKIPGRTVLVIDVSGSMREKISAKSELSRQDAAVALAMLAREVCEEVAIYLTAGSDWRRTHATKRITADRGFSLARTIERESSTLGGGGIFLIQAMDYIKNAEKGNQVDRVIVFTDEQDTGGRGFEPAKAHRLAPKSKNYILNVGSYKNGVNSAQWETITGFSEAALDYILELERFDLSLAAQ